MVVTKSGPVLTAWDQTTVQSRRSADGGQTWQASEAFPIMGTGEACIVELSNGTLHYNTRRHWTPADAIRDNHPAGNHLDLTSVAAFPLVPAAPAFGDGHAIAITGNGGARILQPLTRPPPETPRTTPPPRFPPPG